MKKDKDIIKEFDNMFWLHRVPRRTKMSKDIKDFILEALQAQREEIKGVILEIIEEWDGDGQFVSKTIVKDLKDLLTKI